MMFWAVLLSCGLASAFPAEEAVSELQALAELVRRFHPNPTRYEPPGSLQARLHALQAELQHEGEVHELRLGRAAHELLSPLGDSHLAISIPPYSSDSSEVTLLPLQLYFTESEAWVEVGPEEIPFASSILAIDGVPIQQVLAELQPLAFVDGHRPDAARYQLGRDFPRFHALRYGFAREHAVTIQASDGPRDVRIVSVSRQELRDLRNKAPSSPWRPTHGHGPRVPELVHSEAGTPVIRIPDFGMRPLETWLNTLRQLLESLDPNSPLVLDLRGNEGGFRDAPHALLAMLYAGERLTEWTHFRGLIRKTPIATRGISWPFGSPTERLGNLNMKRVGGHWQYTGDPIRHGWTPPGPVPQRGPQKGPLFLLTDAGTQSAANGLVLMMKAQHPEVNIVGTPPGGACDIHFGDLPLAWRSPHGHLNVLMSVLEIHHVAPPNCQPGQGQAVDTAPTFTAGGFARREDPWLERVDAQLKLQPLQPSP